MILSYEILVAIKLDDTSMLLNIQSFFQAIEPLKCVESVKLTDGIQYLL